MRRELLWLALAVGLIAAVVVGVAWVSSRESVSPSQALPGSISEDPNSRVRRMALGELRALGEDSARAMPEGFSNVWLGMGVELLRRARPNAQRAPEGPETPDNTTIFEERQGEAGRAVWFVSTRLGVLTKAQFLSRLQGAAALRSHFDALRTRYGEPSGFWDCPEAPDRPALRRITWHGQRVSVMEAILVYRAGISVTLVVSPTSDVSHALSQSRCVPVTRETLGRWPVAGNLGNTQ